MFGWLRRLFKPKPLTGTCTLYFRSGEKIMYIRNLEQTAEEHRKEVQGWLQRPEGLMKVSIDDGTELLFRNTDVSAVVIN